MHERYMAIQQKIEIAGKFSGWWSLYCGPGMKWQTALEQHFRNQISGKWATVFCVYQP